jgi:hypothetical protein
LHFSFVEHPMFRKYVWGINLKFKFLSRNTIRNDCMKIYEIEKNKLKDRFLNCSPRVCLTTNAWTSKIILPFMFLKTHFIDNE